MSMNPYTLLGVNEDSTAEEIKKAYLRCKKLYCNYDSNESNAFYLNEMFKEAATTLLKDKKTKKTNSKSKDVQEEEPRFYMTIEEKQYIITSLNREVIAKQDQLGQTKEVFDLGISTKNLYALIGEDNSFMFADEVISRTYDTIGYVYLRNVLTKQTLTTVYKEDDLPWFKGDIFKVSGTNSAAMMASKFIPEELIKNGKITSANLKKLSNIMKTYMVENKDFVEKIFTIEEPNQKTKK